MLLLTVVNISRAAAAAAIRDVRQIVAHLHSLLSFVDSK